MYGYYYETNILFFLRLAKYLHNQDPAALEKILNEMPEFDQYFSDDYCERITYAICSQVVFTDEDVMDEYTGEAIQISTCFFSVWSVTPREAPPKFGSGSRRTATTPSRSATPWWICCSSSSRKTSGWKVC